MSRIVIGSYMVRYPLGGMLSWVYQYLVGFHRLGHEVYFVEKGDYPYSCYDPIKDLMTDDCAYGASIVKELLARVGLGGRWCFVDYQGAFHGLSQSRVREVLRTADLFFDMGTHGAWLAEAADSRLCVLGDGEPGFTQMKMENRRAEGKTLPEYHAYYTAGLNLGTPECTAPTAGQTWRPLPHPVALELFPFSLPDDRASFTTIMNWQSHRPIEFGGRQYGQKDLEFRRFIGLPRQTSAALEVAVAGKQAPLRELRESGWRVRDAHQVTLSFDSFRQYLQSSRGEFSVCKNVFVATKSGWFSDRSAAYLASGRPVVLQDTGFSSHLPCGEGLFAVRCPEEAVEAFARIEADLRHHARRAREVAAEHLDATKVLKRFLDELGC